MFHVPDTVYFWRKQKKAKDRRRAVLRFFYKDETRPNRAAVPAGSTPARAAGTAAAKRAARTAGTACTARSAAAKGTAGTAFPHTAGGTAHAAKGTARTAAAERAPRTARAAGTAAPEGTTGTAAPAERTARTARAAGSAAAAEGTAGTGARMVTRPGAKTRTGTVVRGPGRSRGTGWPWRTGREEVEGPIDIARPIISAAVPAAVGPLDGHQQRDDDDDHHDQVNQIHGAASSIQP